MGVDLNRTKRIFAALRRVAPDLGNIEQHAVSMVDGSLPLYCELLETGNDFRRIELGHYWALASGVVVPDVTFEACVFLDWELAEVASYQFGSNLEDAYPVIGEPPILSIHRRINRLFERWLEGLAKQGHILRVEGKPTDKHAGQSK